jgi:acyl-CoA synthetase (AMP-forming)/AMP-acid ligase II
LGLPFTPDFKIRIVDEKGRNAEVNQIGEIIISSPTVMQGYYDQKAETEKTLRNGWLYTGDYGYEDKEGYLYFAGLKKNIAKVGGSMVDLQEVQDILLSHPAISQVRVYSKEDDMRGHVIAAEVGCRVDSNLTEREIREYCSKYLSLYKIPKMIEFTREVTPK